MEDEILQKTALCEDPTGTAQSVIWLQDFQIFDQWLSKIVCFVGGGIIAATSVEEARNAECFRTLGQLRGNVQQTKTMDAILFHCRSLHLVHTTPVH